MGLNPQDAIARIAEAARGKRVFLQGGAAEPLALTQAWRAAPEHAADITFCAILVPGVNNFDYATLHQTARLETFLLPPEVLDSVRSGRATHLPLDYTDVYAHLARSDFAAAVFHVSPPDGAGYCTLGVSADSASAALGRAGLSVGLVNHAMPSLSGAQKIPLSAFDIVVECDTPLATAADAPPADEAIAAQVARMVPHAATIQTGIGRLPSAILDALRNHRDLKIHSGLISDAHLALMDAGAIADAPDAITTGIAVGSADFYARLPEVKNLRVAAIPETHGLDVLSKLPRLTTINSALEVDLSGRINGEYLGERRISSVGGLRNFMQGADAAQDGRAIVALGASGKGGVSRIVPKLSHVTVESAKTLIVVTEHGIADLRGLDARGRAEALIAIAAPEHRAALSSYL